MVRNPSAGKTVTLELVESSLYYLRPDNKVYTYRPEVGNAKYFSTGFMRAKPKVILEELFFPASLRPARLEVSLPAGTPAWSPPSADYYVNCIEFSRMVYHNLCTNTVGKERLC